MFNGTLWRRMRLYTPVATLLCAFAFASSASPADRVNLSLDLAKSGKHAGIYVAIDKGYCKAANIEIGITAGRGSGVAVTNVETGNSQFGMVAFSNVVINRS